MKRLFLLSSVLLVGAQALAADSSEPSVSDRSHELGLMLAPKVGFFKSTSSLDGASYIAAEVGYLTPLLDHRLAIVLEGTWYRPSTKGSTSSPQLTLNGITADSSYRLTERQFALLLSLVYRLQDALPHFTPYAGLGPGYYLHRSTATAFGTTNVETEGSLGFQFLGGAEYEVGPGAAFLEVHYHFTRVDFVTTGNANVGGFLAGSLGYRFRF